LKNIGILALQGDFAKHAEVIRRIGHNPVQVRTPAVLGQVDGLIIPGGESTTLQKLFALHNFDRAIVDFSREKPIMGTCAGLILLSKKADRLESPPLDLIDIDVMRNAYGRQKESFFDEISISLNGKAAHFEGVFIRAPKIVRLGKTVIPLARYRDDVVMASAGKILVCTFHPELTDDTRIHEYFIRKFIGS
jgi:5'-phosphate synthase pdxT subunit